MQQLTADVEIAVGARVTYWVEVAVEYCGECLAAETVRDQDIYVDFRDMDDVEKITSARLAIS